MAPRGRPSKYTPERVKRITDALAAGNSRRAAAAYGGINEDTLGAWARNFTEFSESIKSAEAQAEVAHVANIAKAARDGTWQASAWWLERRRAAEWGRREQHEYTAVDGGAVRVVIRTIDDRDDQRAIAAPD